MRSGLSLEELSAQTKVSVDLWDGMEKNDFSRWPTGVSARSYIRAYAEAVGADPHATVDEFCRLIPQGDRRVERIVRGTAEFLGHQLVWSDDLPALAEGDRRAPVARQDGSGGPWWIGANPRGVALGLDLIAVVGFAAAIAAAARIDFWMTLAVTALLYHGISLVLVGCSPAVWAIDTYMSARLARRPGVPVFRRLALMRNDDRSADRDTAV
jgi:Helix-turn-helix domain